MNFLLQIVIEYNFLPGLHKPSIPTAYLLENFPIVLSATTHTRDKETTLGEDFLLFCPFSLIVFGTACASLSRIQVQCFSGHLIHSETPEIKAATSCQWECSVKKPSIKPRGTRCHRYGGRTEVTELPLAGETCWPALVSLQNHRVEAFLIQFQSLFYSQGLGATFSSFLRRVKLKAKTSTSAKTGAQRTPACPPVTTLHSKGNINPAHLAFVLLSFAYAAKSKCHQSVGAKLWNLTHSFLIASQQAGTIGTFPRQKKKKKRNRWQ